GEAAAGRGGLSRRPRCEDRPAAGAELRLPACAHAGAEGRDGLDGQAVRQDRRSARDPRHRLQPVPGKDAEGQAASVLVGLERRLSRRRELPVPAVRPQLEGALRAARQAQWNHPVWWPLGLIAAAALLLAWVARRAFAARERAVAITPARG